MRSLASPAESVCVLLPGMLCSARLWRAQREHLNRVANTHVVELTGHSIEEMVGQVLALPHRRLVVAGLSLGGIVALSVAVVAPDRVSGLAVFSATARPPRPAQRAGWDAMATRTRDGDFASITPQTLLPLLVTAEHASDPEIVEVILGMAAEVGPAVFLNQLSAQASRIDLRPLIRALRCPTLVVAGADDALAPLAAQKEAAALLPRARLEVLAGCGHLSPLERPEEVSSLLQDWLIDLDRR